MRIAFVVIGNSRRSNYLNGYTLRYGGGGGSGTDSSCILVAEYLAKQGHDVVFATDELEPQLESEYKSMGRTNTPGTEIYGVKYTNKNFDGIENRHFDILVSMLWFQEYNQLPITVTKGLIYWSHMQWIYGIEEITNFAKNNKLSLGFIHISEWEKLHTGSLTKNILQNQKDLNVKITTIPNPIMDQMVEEVLQANPIRKPHKFIFHAAWARGGDVAVDAVRQLNFEDTEFHAFDYLMATHNHDDSFFNLHNGVDKKTLFTHLAESEYFIYPLYTPYKDVHKDTFSCVVAEAIAMGCIPVTYRLGALPENFEKHCAWLEFPPDADPAKLQNESLSKDEQGIFKCTTNIVEKIKYLEDNPQVKYQIRLGGKDSIVSRFSVNKVGQMWESFIKTLN